MTLWLLLTMIRLVFCQNHNNNTTIDSLKHIIYTFYEPISPEQRFTSMSDADDATLLEFWKSSWTNAGWEPRVLTLKDAKRHPLYESFQQELTDLCIDEFGQFSLLRWLAMAQAGGGWLVDYDAFPLHQFLVDNEEMPHNGEMTIYEAVAPILASGSADAWLDTAKFLLEHAKSCGKPKNGRLSFWTDTLGVLSAWRDENVTFHVEKQVLDGRKALRTEPLTIDDCDKRPFRGKRVVHFGHFAMLEGASVAPELRLPRHRVTVAKEWLPRWMEVCGASRGNETVVA